MSVRGRLRIIIGSHNNKPYTLADTSHNNQIEEMYEQSYKPFLQLLYSHRHIRFTLYYSGLLFDWLRRYHEEFMSVLSEMVKRSQIEMLGGAFFEPFLPLVNKTDRIGQIEHMTNALKSCLGVRPRGLWIPAGVWDQRIVANINAAGMRYVFYDTGRQKYSFPFYTEDSGKSFAVFPLFIDIVDMMFTKRPQQIIKVLRDIYQREDNAVVTILFDGGRLADYHKTEAAMAWYADFLTLLVQNSDWIKPVHARDVVQQHMVRYFQYPAETTLARLMCWMYPEFDEKWENTFRSVLALYPASARVYARMQHTQEIIKLVHRDKSRKLTAKQYLWRGQNHFIYWHNCTGGIYNSSLRKAAFAAFIEAEKITREKGVFSQHLSRADIDFDGLLETIYRGNKINAYVHCVGARLFELDYMPRNWNYLDTFQRIHEPFHSVKQHGKPDTWHRSAFVDHLLSTNHTLADFSKNGREVIADFANTEYTSDVVDKDRFHVAFVGVCNVSKSMCAPMIYKCYNFFANRVEVEYRIQNIGMENLVCNFACEVNLSFFSLDEEFLQARVTKNGEVIEYSPKNDIEIHDVQDIQYIDKYNKTLLTLSSSTVSKLWMFPVKAVGMYKHEPCDFYQYNCTVLQLPLSLDAMHEQVFKIVLRIEKMAKEKPSRRKN